jgi:hypothetical protein
MSGTIGPETVGAESASPLAASQFGAPGTAPAKQRAPAAMNF